jgi:hypothetical protein
MSIERYAMVARDDPEWDVMWKMVKLYHGGYDCRCPDSGEVWQYMGSNLTPSGQWAHGFRHRNLPATQSREYWSCPASPGWKPAEVHEFNDECPF